MFAHFIQKAGVWWMMPIILLAWVALSLSLERLWYWWRLVRRQRRTEPLLAGLFGERAPTVAQARALDSGSSRRDPTARALWVFLDNLLLEQVPAPIAESRARDEARLATEDSRRFVGILTFIANLAGTRGLLGTVAGVSMSFEHLARANPKGLALSLSTAMYTTIGGIFLFMVAYLAITIFGTFSDRLETRLGGYLTRITEHCQLENAGEAVLVEEA